MTRKRTAFKLALYYRLIATASFLLGMVFVVLGLWVGLADAFGVFVSNLLEGGAVDRAMAEANLPLMFLFMLLGTFVWQVGKAAGLHWTMATAVQEGQPARGAGQPSGRAAVGEQGGTSQRASSGSSAGQRASSGSSAGQRASSGSSAGQAARNAGEGGVKDPTDDGETSGDTGSSPVPDPDSPPSSTGSDAPAAEDGDETDDSWTGASDDGDPYVPRSASGGQDSDDDNGSVSGE